MPLSILHSVQTKHEGHRSWVELSLCFVDSSLVTKLFQCNWYYRFPCRPGVPARRTYRLRPDKFRIGSEAARNRREYVYRPPASCAALTAGWSAVTPIVCDLADIGKWKHLLANVEAVINTTQASSPDIPAMLVGSVTEAARSMRPAYSTKLTYVDTSATWVHGDNRDEIVTDTTPAENSNPYTIWRAYYERDLVSNTVLNGIIIRAPWVIGRSGSDLGNKLFPEAKAGEELVGVGNPGGRCSIVHQDDLADAYLRAVERGSIAGGSIFDITNEFTESVDDILATLCKISGATGYRYRKPRDGKHPFSPRYNIRIITNY